MTQLSLLFALIAVLTTPAHANVVGSDLQSFNPTSDGLDFVTVESARPLASGYFLLGGFLDYASNTLPDALSGPAGVPGASKYSVSSKMASGDIHFGLGLIKDWSVGVNISSVLAPYVDNSQLRSYFQKQGMTDVRVSSKYRVYAEAHSAVAVVLSANFPQVANDPFLGDLNRPMYEAQLSYEYAAGHWLYGLNGGFRFRNPGTVLIANSPYEPVGNQILASAAAAYHFTRTHWSAIGEIYSAIPTKGSTNYTVGQLSIIEALLGLKYVAMTGLAFHTGVTGGIQQGISTPDYRVYAGINWAPMRLWDKSDSDSQASNPPAREKSKVTSTTAQDLSVFDQAPTAPVEKFSVREINFESGSSEVPDGFYPFLKRLADYANKGRPLHRLTISGHTDSRGTAIYNQELSTRRAEAVKDVLVTHFDLPSDKIETIGYGPTRPIDTNETPEGRSRNRRVEFDIERE